MPNVTFYNGFKKAINSTKRPTGGSSTNVKLKGGCSVIHPVFKLNRNSEGINFVKWGSNYYFVDDIAHLVNDEIEVSCTRDPMATFKEDIGGSTQYVTRSASTFDGNVQDTRYPTLANPTTSYKPLTVLNSAFNQGGYIVGVISNSGEGVTYYRLSRNDLHRLLNYMFSDAWLTADDIGVALQKELINPFQYISSIMWFPFLEGGGGSFDDEISFGFWGDTNCYGHIITDSNRSHIASDSINVNRHPQAATRGNYLNGAPYTRIMLEAFCFGTIPIDANYLVNDDSLTVRILTDLYTGVGELIVSNSGHVICKQTAQVGVPIQISQITQPVLQPVLSAIGAVGSFATKNFVGGAQGIGDTIKSALPQVQTSGSMGSKVAYVRPAGVYTQFYNIADEDNATIGRPLCKPRTISSLSGYIECDNVDLVTSATPSEKETIINYMQTGFFYE